jgi:hypothetical protein
MPGQLESADVTIEGVILVGVAMAVILAWNGIREFQDWRNRRHGGSRPR